MQNEQKRPGGRPRQQVNTDQVRPLGPSLRQGTKRLRLGFGTVTRTIREAGATQTTPQAPPTRLERSKSPRSASGAAPSNSKPGPDPGRPLPEVQTSKSKVRKIPMSSHNDERLGKAPGGPIRPDPQNPDARATGPPYHHQENQPKAILSRSAKRQQKALFKGALEADRKLKREHRAYWKVDPKGLRAVLKKARARVFRLKPGPKPDAQKNARIKEAAGKLARGAKWQQLYPVYIDHHATITEHTRGYAEEGFQKEVNRYLRKHPRLRRKFSKKTVTTQSTP